MISPTKTLSPWRQTISKWSETFFEKSWSDERTKIRNTCFWINLRNVKSFCLKLMIEWLAFLFKNVYFFFNKCYGFFLSNQKKQPHISFFFLRTIIPSIHVSSVILLLLKQISSYLTESNIFFIFYFSIRKSCKLDLLWKSPFYKRL